MAPHLADEPADDEAPAWFTRAVDQVPEHRDVEVAGARVHYRAWGSAGAPGVVLVHGGAAHSGWWDHVAPQLTGARVVALDLTGHGDSDRRDRYDMRTWADEVCAVAAAEHLDRPVVVGHSMGGWVSVATAVAAPGAVRAAVYIDSPLGGPPPEGERLRARTGATPPVYADLAEAVARFRTVPAQEVLLPYVREHVGRGSLRAVEGGWSWKFDPHFGGERLPLEELLPQVTTPVALLRCEHGLVDAAMTERMRALVPGRLPVVDLPDAGHHPMLDQPLALVAALRALLAVWPTR